MNDSDLKSMLYEILQRNLEFEVPHVSLAVEDGRVTLLGFVENRSQKHAVAREIEFLEEVKSVSNELELKRPFDDLFPGMQEREGEGLVNNRTDLI